MTSLQKWWPYFAFLGTAAGTVLGLLFKTKPVEAYVAKALRDWSEKRRMARVKPARILTAEEWKDILDSGRVGLQTLLLLIQREYGPDRVTVMTYRRDADGAYWATCVVEVLEPGMNSVVDRWQNVKLADGMYQEVERINSLPRRMRFVADARTEDVAPLRDALLASGVSSAYYQSLPTALGKPSAMLSLSWHRPHKLTKAEAATLLLSGYACAALHLLMEKMKPSEPS